MDAASAVTFQISVVSEVCEPLNCVDGARTKGKKEKGGIQEGIN